MLKYSKKSTQTMTDQKNRRHFGLRGRQMLNNLLSET